MRTLRLAILGSSPCHLCDAACCRQNGHAYAALLEGDERRRFVAFSADVVIEHAGRRVVERVIPYRAGRCTFLGDDDRCTIYEDRPMSCRRFECVRHYHCGGSDVTRHGAFLNRNARVLQMLERL